MGLKAYIQNTEGIFFYEFPNLSELRKMQVECVKKNMETGEVSEWECCDKIGEWSGFKQVKLRYSRMDRIEREEIFDYRRLVKKPKEELEEVEVQWLEENIWIGEFIEWLDDDIEYTDGPEEHSRLMIALSEIDYELAESQKEIDKFFKAKKLKLLQGQSM